LAHRLDRDTSGCLVLGRHAAALRRLGRLFAEGKVEKVYWTVVSGAPRESEGRIEAPLLKQPRGTVGWRMVVDPDGQHAVTDYRVLGVAGGRAWLELRPRTGRTHQIRVHCAALGCPVVGDPAYGGPGDHRLQLHARAISLPLYPMKPPVAVTAPVPAHMHSLLTALGYREGGDAPARSAVA
jgi:tRNA pseudouridine32 synthase/23S rRNA pseudouridine746 synthase/23S rRNA pseudouridine1911/1915/1917 synthase